MSLRVIWQYMDRSIYCHMTLSAMHYLLYMYEKIYIQTWMNFCVYFINLIFVCVTFRFFFISSKTCSFGHLYSAVTCIKWSSLSCPVIENVIWIEPDLRGHLSYKVIYYLFQRWPLNTRLTVSLIFLGVPVTISKTQPIFIFILRLF